MRRRLYTKQSLPDLKSMGLKPIKAKELKVDLRNLKEVPSMIKTDKCFVNYDKFDKKSLKPIPFTKKEKEVLRKKSISRDKRERQRSQDAFKPPEMVLYFNRL